MPITSKLPGATGAMLAIAPATLALSQPFAHQGEELLSAFSTQGCLAAVLMMATAMLSLWGTGNLLRAGMFAVSTVMAAVSLLAVLPTGEQFPASGFWLLTLAMLALARTSIQRLAALEGAQIYGILTAAIFGLWIVYFWELLIVAFDVPRVLLPAPSVIVTAMIGHATTLATDFLQTVCKSVLVGYVLGCGSGIGVAIAIDRSPFMQKGLLPIASLSSTIPLVGVAPIAVMWFGFDWPSKAAVIVLMTFFPALVSTLAGLNSSGKLERELMYSYAASHRRTLLDLRLPAAMPFIFNALKVNATLALIGAIVAEFFGSPTSGMGFRISTEAARMNMPLVWSSILVASAVGSLSYALLVRLERRINFWHPSIRST